MSNFIKLVAPDFFDYQVGVEDYYQDIIAEAVANGDEGVFCFFEGDRHAYLPLSLLQTLDLDKMEIEEEGLKGIEITDDTIFV